MPFATHDEYFAAAPPEARARLEKIQRKVEAVVPDATRCISYGMPAFRGKRVFFYFAAFRAHIGIYPPVRHDAALIEALGDRRGPKGNLTFPLDEPLPLALIARVAVALHREVELKQTPGGASTARKPSRAKAASKKPVAKKAAPRKVGARGAAASKPTTKGSARRTDTVRRGAGRSS